MAETPKHKKPAKKGSSHVDQSKKKVVASPKKKFNLSKTQWGIIGLVVVALIGVGVYFGLQTKQNTTADAASCVSKSYNRGDNGNCVKYIQQLVNNTIARADGFRGSSYAKKVGNLSKLTVDGSFGPKTEAAIKTIQSYTSVSKSGSSGSYKKLTANGTVNSSTWDVICNQGGYKPSTKSYLSAYSSAGCRKAYVSVR